MMERMDNVREEILDLNNRAVTLAANGKEEEAFQYFEKALALDAAVPETYISMGNVYASMEEFDKAYDAYSKILVIDKHYAVAYFHLGNICFIKGDADEAIKNFNLAISEGYNDALAYFNLGLVYEDKGDVDYALRNYSKAIFKNADAPEYRLKKATLQIAENRYEEALETLTDMTKYAPDIFEGYHYKFETLCALNRFEEAEAVLQTAGELFPEDVSIFYDKIQLQTRLGNIDRALQMIEEAEKMEGHEGEARNLAFEKAKLCGMKEDVDSAVTYFNECLSFETEEYTDYETRYFLMNIFLSQKNYQGMLDHAEKILLMPEDNPFVRAAFYYRAMAVRELQGLNAAKDYYKEAVSLYRTVTISEPGTIDAYLFRALCHKDLGEYEKALELVEFVESLSADSSEIHVIKANVFEAMGRGEEAKEQMEIAKTMKPELGMML